MCVKVAKVLVKKVEGALDKFGSRTNTQHRARPVKVLLSVT